eukprot:136905_1
MLQYRHKMNKVSRDTMTRLILSIVVYYGYYSSKKSGRMKYEIEKETKTKTTINDENDNDEKSDTSYESEPDDVIVWKPIFVQYLNQFLNDQNAVIKMKARKVQTVYDSFKTYTDARNT